MLQFLHPEQYRQVFHKTAENFLKYLKEHHGRLSSDQIGEFVRQNYVSRATFYNKVLPRLAHAGLIVKTQEAGGRKLSVTWCNQFATYLVV